MRLSEFIRFTNQGDEMKYLSLIVLTFTLQWAEVATAKAPAHSQELVVLLPKDLPEAAQSAGESMTLHSFGDGSTFLYVEQSMGTRLAVFDVSDPAHIKSVGTVGLESPSTFDFVRDIDDSATLICFRDNKGAAVMDFKKPKRPSIVRSDELRQAARAEAIGFSGLLMAAEPRRSGDIPVFDYQVVDVSNPQRPKLLATVPQVQKKLTDPATGALYLLGTSGLTVIRQPRVEENHRLAATSN
jgi:hypothetical protein